MLEYGNYIIFDNKEEFLKDWKVDDSWGACYNRYPLRDDRNPNDLRNFNKETIKEYIDKTPFAIRKWTGEHMGYSTVFLDEALLAMLRKTNQQIKMLQATKDNVLKRLGNIDNF